MNPNENVHDTTEQEVVGEVQQEKGVLHTVTPLSKYLAMMVFTALPFIGGGWVGYTYSPEKVVEVERIVIEEIEVNEGVENAVSDMEKEDMGYFNWCIENGGEDRTPDYNAPVVCVLNDKVYESNCVSNEKYFVVQRDSSAGLTDIVVKQKTSPEQKFFCKYSVEDTDFEIKSNDPDYLLALEGVHLLIDSGTGPGPRGLTVYDLDNRAKVFTDSYLGPVKINDNLVTYWTTSSIAATENNCAEYNENKSWGLESAIDTQIALNLVTLSKTELGESRCTARQ